MLGTRGGIRWSGISIALFMNLAGLNPIALAEMDVSGSYEGQVTGMEANGMDTWLLSNRLRIDLKADMGNRASVAADCIMQTYHGDTQINGLSLLPDDVAAGLRSAFGDAAESMFIFTYDVGSVALDNAYVTLYQGPLSLRLGRQQLPWGTGYAWNPTDVFNTKSLLDPTYEKPGQDAIKAEWGFGESGGITLVWQPGATWAWSTRAIRLKTQMQGFDVSASWIEQVYDQMDIFSDSPQTREMRRVFGMDMVGQVVGFGVWGEGAMVMGPADARNWQLVLGTDTTFDFQTTLMLEYFRDWGGDAGQEYSISQWVELIMGQRSTLGRDYGMIMLSHPATDLLEISLLAVANCNDRSIVLVPTAAYSYSDDVIITLVGNFFLGAADSEYGGLAANAGYIRIKIYF